MKTLYWYSFECYNHPEYGVVFEVRVRQEDVEAMNCPVCGAECKSIASWEADEGGYGGTSSAEAALAQLARLILLRRRGK